MFQTVARQVLSHAKVASSGTLFTPGSSGVFRVGLFGLITASKTAKAVVGMKVWTKDDNGVENEISLDLFTGSADNDFADGIIQAGAGQDIDYSVIMTSGFPTDCDFTFYAVVEQDVPQVVTV